MPCLRSCRQRCGCSYGAAFASAFVSPCLAVCWQLRGMVFALQASKMLRGGEGVDRETVVTILTGFVQSEVQRGRGEGQVWFSEFNLNETSSRSTYINYWTQEQGVSKKYSLIKVLQIC